MLGPQARAPGAPSVGGRACRFLGMTTSRIRWALGFALLVAAYGVAVYVPHHSVVGYASCQSMFSPMGWFQNGCANASMRLAILGLGIVAAITTWQFGPVTKRPTPKRPN
jgi:hypothetical protein